MFLGSGASASSGSGGSGDSGDSGGSGGSGGRRAAAAPESPLEAFLGELGAGAYAPLLSNFSVPDLLVLGDDSLEDLGLPLRSEIG